MNTYFITGATGVLGSAIVRELLLNTKDKLILLIRAESDGQALQKIESLCTFLEISFLSVRSQVEFVLGNVELENFGLDSELYSRLGSEVTHIIHSAASLKMNLPLDIARRASVLATESILRFAKLSQEKGVLKKVEMVSTVGIGGKWKGALPEKWIHDERIFHNTYEQSKAEAELLIEQYLVRGLPITVHRPSMIIGHSKTGHVSHFQIFYHLIEFLSGRRTAGFMPNLSNRKVDLIPVDFVSQVILWSSRTSQTIGKILHLCSGPELAVSLVTIKMIVEEKFLERELSLPKSFTLPIEWFVKLTQIIIPIVPDRQKRMFTVLPIFLDYLLEDQVFANENTVNLLKVQGFQQPRPQDFLDPVISYYLNKK